MLRTRCGQFKGLALSKARVVQIDSLFSWLITFSDFQPSVLGHTTYGWCQYFSLPFAYSSPARIAIDWGQGNRVASREADRLATLTWTVCTVQKENWKTIGRWHAGAPGRKLADAWIAENCLDLAKTQTRILNASKRRWKTQPVLRKLENVRRLSYLGRLLLFGWSGSFFVEKSFLGLLATHGVTTLAKEQISQWFNPTDPAFHLVASTGHHQVGLGHGQGLALQNEVIVHHQELDRVPGSGGRQASSMGCWWRGCYHILKSFTSRLAKLDLIEFAPHPFAPSGDACDKREREKERRCMRLLLHMIQMWWAFKKWVRFQWLNFLTWVELKNLQPPLAIRVAKNF